MPPLSSWLRILLLRHAPQCPAHASPSPTSSKWDYHTRSKPLPRADSPSSPSGAWHGGLGVVDVG
eukprot:2040696-Pyramimonas_sp.AAC.1